jgi:hypothetical protein
VTASNRISRALPLAVLLLTLLAAGCGKSAQTRFYTLTGDPEAAKTAPCVSLGVGPVDFPPYLDRTQIVTRLDGSRMHLAEFDQWIEPLHDAFARALAAGLTQPECGKPVAQSPWPPGVKPRYQLTVQVRRFDAVPAREAALEASWSILDDSGKVLAYKSSVLREPLQGPDYAQIAQAQSALTAKLAREVAAELAKLPR